MKSFWTPNGNTTSNYMLLPVVTSVRWQSSKELLLEVQTVATKEGCFKVKVTEKGMNDSAPLDRVRIGWEQDRSHSTCRVAAFYYELQMDNMQTIGGNLRATMRNLKVGSKTVFLSVPNLKYMQRLVNVLYQKRSEQGKRRERPVA